MLRYSHFAFRSGESNAYRCRNIIDIALCPFKCESARCIGADKPVTEHCDELAAIRTVDALSVQRGVFLNGKNTCIGDNAAPSTAGRISTGILSRSVADIEIIHAALRYGAPRGEPRRICTAVKSVWQNQKHYCSGKGSFLQKKAGNRGSVPLRGEFWFKFFCALLTEY